MTKIIQFIGKISYQIWLGLFVVSTLVCVIALRHNNQHMVKLRGAVYAADKNNGDVNAALNNLRNYVYGHMNTNLSSGNNNIKPPIQLKYTYNRLYEAQLAQVESANAAVYTEAQNYCQHQPGASGLLINGVVPCVQNYVVNHGVKDANINIPAGLYEFDFANPSWSPDLAGWSLLAGIFFFAALVLKLVASFLKR